MKRWLLGCCLVFIAPTCSGSDKPASSTSPTNSPKTAFTLAVQDRFPSGDIEELLHLAEEFCDEDADQFGLDYAVALDKRREAPHANAHVVVLHRLAVRHLCPDRQTELDQVENLNPGS